MSPFTKFLIPWSRSTAHRDEPADIDRFLHDPPFVGPNKIDEYPSFRDWKPLINAPSNVFTTYRPIQPETELFQPYSEHMRESVVRTSCPTLSPCTWTLLNAFSNIDGVPDCLIPGLTHRHPRENSVHSILAESSTTKDAGIETASASDMVRVTSHPFLLPPLRFGDFPDFLSFIP
jgi:hypothetical protein